MCSDVINSCLLFAFRLVTPVIISESIGKINGAVIYLFFTKRISLKVIIPYQWNVHCWTSTKTPMGR